jgi:hypothetical protein
MLERAWRAPLRSFRLLVVGITTCGLGWFWLAFYLYLEWFRRQRARGSAPHEVY